jgi:DNA repair proteins
MNNLSNDNSDIIKGIDRFYCKNKVGLKYAEEAVKETIRRESNSDVSSRAGEMDWRGRNGGVRTLGIGISTELIKKGYTDLRGKEVRSPEQLATLAQVFRDPRFETLRFFYIKDDKIVGHEGITSRLPASSVAFSNLPNKEDFIDKKDFIRQVKTAQIRFLMDMLNRLERLKADGYYLLHGHPSGISVVPSKEDIIITSAYRSALSCFMGHVIIDSNKYSFIDKDLNVTEHKLCLGEDLLLKPSKPHTLLGEDINSNEMLAKLAKFVQLANDYSVVIYISAKNVIRAIQEVPDGLFKREKECVDYLRGRMCDFGSSRAFLITQNQNIKEFASNMVKKGYLLDAIITDGDYGVTSVRENGAKSCYPYPDKWMNIRINKAYQVSENGPANSYTNVRPSKSIQSSSEVHKGKDRLPEMGF